MLREGREVIVPKAQGVVLELGAGAGANFEFYAPDQVTKVYALEPEPGLVSRLRKAARKAPVPIEVLTETAETLSLPPGSVDTVLVTFALCTIPDVPAALAGARRALKTGGQLLFCEHGRAPDDKVARTQARLEPVWKKLFGGCHLTRDIPALIGNAGFKITDIEAKYLPSVPRFAGYNYRGAARSS
ncbi:MAG: methyltransferase domain-containing protein [Caulobacterales bacterium]